MAIHFTPSTSSISDLTLHLKLAHQAGPEQTEIRTTFFPAEWHPQSGVQLTWPHAATDWAPLLAEVDKCFVSIALEILVRNELLLIVTPEPDRIESLLRERIPSRLLPQVRYFECPTNDTWARDHAFLTLLTEAGPRLLDFRFNGWGNKFPSDLDNAINQRLINHQSPIIQGSYEPHLDFVFEGGSIESDGKGTLLTTSECLLSSNRNPDLTRVQIEERLLRYFHADRVLWLDHGYLAGDDTDSHIDTLARLAPDNRILFVECDWLDDIHFEPLRRMKEQLAAMTDADGLPYALIPLPLPDPIFDGDGNRLPATYANYLIVNDAVIVPTYRQPATDDLALGIISRAFPDHTVKAVDSTPLIIQHGSLHCSTMQIITRT